MRRDPTPEEDALRQHLRRGALGVRFRRQHPVGGYVPDFVCLSRMLAIEVDGQIHQSQADRDGNRDAYLTKLGFQVLRFPNDRVMKDIDTVLKTIANAIRARTSVSDAVEE